MDAYYKVNIDSLKRTIEAAEVYDKLKPKELFKLVCDHEHSLYWYERSREFMDYDTEFK